MALMGVGGLRVPDVGCPPPWHEEDQPTSPQQPSSPKDGLCINPHRLGQDVLCLRHGDGVHGTSNLQGSSFLPVFQLEKDLSLRHATFRRWLAELSAHEDTRCVNERPYVITHRSPARGWLVGFRC